MNGDASVASLYIVTLKEREGGRQGGRERERERERERVGGVERKRKDGLARDNVPVSSIIEEKWSSTFFL